MAKKLNQILAVEKNLKNRAETEFTKAHQAITKVDLVTGMVRKFKPRDEDGDNFPDENKKVAISVPQQLIHVKRVLAEYFDVTATRDRTNCEAFADVVVDGQTILKQVPATHLLFLEKKLVDLHTFVRKLPVLDPAEDWEKDEALGVYVSQAVQTTKTKKVVKPMVLVQATKEHPAQVKEVTEDVIIGTWTAKKHSSALPAPQVEAMLERVLKLQKAVKMAREEANSAPIVDLKTGDAVLNYVFGGGNNS